MNLLPATAILFLITGLLHITIPFRFGNNAATRPVAAFGVIYLILGVLLILGVFSWLPVVALILTLIGGIGASTSSMPIQNYEHQPFCSSELIS